MKENLGLFFSSVKTIHLVLLAVVALVVFSVRAADTAYNADKKVSELDEKQNEFAKEIDDRVDSVEKDLIVIRSDVSVIREQLKDLEEDISRNSADQKRQLQRIFEALNKNP